MDLPLINFDGYRLISCDYNIKSSVVSNTFFSIETLITKQENNKLVVRIVILADFDNQESHFVFDCFYTINNINSFSSYNANDKKRQAFALVFPFIREKIHNITTDSIDGMLLPTINATNIDFNNKITYTKNKRS